MNASLKLIALLATTLPLLTGCETPSPRPVPVVIKKDPLPPLPPSARVEPLSKLWPYNASTDIEDWTKLLEGSTLPLSAAPVSTTPTH